MMYGLVRLLDRLLVRLLTRLEVSGLENLPSDGAFIATGNHLGALDPVLVYFLVDRRDIILMIAEKHRKYALARWLVKTLDAIYVDRFGADFAAMRQVLARLKKGWVMIIAPEGTRSKTSGLLPGRPGAAYLAVKSGAPVLPVAVIGTEDDKVLVHLKRFRRVPVKIVVGKPYTLSPLPGVGRDEALQLYTEEIMCRIAALLPEGYRGVYTNHPKIAEFVNCEEYPPGM
jgi:1-acyl-sn-glycerol-3-phosphate acyltransferase